MPLYLVRTEDDQMFSWRGDTAVLFDKVRALAPGEQPWIESTDGDLFRYDRVVSMRKVEEHDD
jgi:hypothetical protein